MTTETAKTAMTGNDYPSVTNGIALPPVENSES